MNMWENEHVLQNSFDQLIFLVRGMQPFGQHQALNLWPPPTS